MSTQLENNRFDSSTTLLEFLLQEQGEMSATEYFSRWHDANPLAAANYKSLMPATSPTIGQQYAFEVDLDVCSGCKACVVACHSVNGLQDQETWRKVGALTSRNPGSLPIVQHVTTACHHCVDPGCLKGCPVQAYEKDPTTGIVRHLDDQCFGCSYCTMMCPYEVPQYSSSLGIVRKCDMCSQRLKIGEAPACVQACPNQAIRITIVDTLELTEHVGNRSTTSALVATAPPSHLTIPTTRYVSRRDSLDLAELRPSDLDDTSVQEGHLPLVMMIVLTQASVGMWLVLAGVPWLFGSRLEPKACIIATTFGVVGVHAALLHLGRPWLAYRAFLGWRTSWLSREAIGFGVFLASASIVTFMTAIPSGLLSIGLTDWIIVSASGFVATIGVLSAACTAMIYIATQRELWSPVRTGFDFVCSTIGLGIVGASPCVNGLTGHHLLIGSLLCGLSILPKILDYSRGIVDVSARDKRNSYTSGSSWVSPEQWSLSARSGRLLRGRLGWQARTTLGLFVLAIVLAGTSSLYCLEGQQATASGWIVFALSLMAQLFHRWLYFASVVYRRMPGAAA
jgi:formate dehydrogenase iron-sulfur subunit